MAHSSPIPASPAPIAFAHPIRRNTILGGLIVNAPRLVLELGCGIGEIARRLAARMDRVDAVEPSLAMLELARTLPGGERRNIQWYCRTAAEHGFASLVRPHRR
jgi:ubiquinone/menaquinone biosynthesis C-methylase UbiE